jgi:hypothetical protein
MANYTYEKVHISKLHPDVENFRFDPVKDEKEAIMTMVNQIPTKIYNMIKSILDNGGIDPSILPNIVPYEKESKEYVVMEGNRRICSLKIIKDVSIIKQTSEYNKIVKLLEKYDLTRIPDEYYCTLYQNKEDTFFWTYLRHSGELDGEGLVSWDSLAIDRFRYGTSQASPTTSYYIINYLNNNTDYNVKNSRFITTLNRIIDSSPGKKYYAVEVEDRQLVFSKDIGETVSKLCLLIENLENKNINTRNANTVDQIQDWIDRLEKEYQSKIIGATFTSTPTTAPTSTPTTTPTSMPTTTPTSTPTTTPTSTPTTTPTSTPTTTPTSTPTTTPISTPTTTPTSRPTSKARPVKLFEDLTYTHVDAKSYGGIIKLGTELTKLSKGATGGNYTTFPICTAMLLRAYIEQAFKYYLNKKGHWDKLCSSRKNTNGDPALGEILIYCRNNKKLLFTDKTQLRLFGILFESDATLKDYLDLNIHHPNIVTVTSIELNGFSNLGLSSFLNYLIQ